jgi:serine/threonine protein kinase
LFFVCLLSSLFVLFVFADYSSDQVSDTLRDLLSSCLRTNPAERPTAAECLRHPFFSHFRTNGAAMPIPCPPGFPPPKPSSSPSEEAAGATVGDGERSERSERRARKALEIEQRNERHMLEQVCKLMVQRGMTSRPSTAATTTASASASPPLPDTAAAAGAAPSSSPRRPVSAPLDPKLCDRICARLSSLLKVSAEAVRTVLVQQHNQYVGLAAP